MLKRLDEEDREDDELRREMDRRRQIEPTKQAEPSEVPRKKYESALSISDPIQNTTMIEDYYVRILAN